MATTRRFALPPRGAIVLFACFANAVGGCGAPVDARATDGGGGGASDTGPARPDDDGGADATDDGADASDAGDPHANINQVWPGMGCGRLLPLDQPQTARGTPIGYKHYRVMGTGANLTGTADPSRAGPRTFWVRVPPDYDPSRPYRVVFVGQACGGWESANTQTLQFFKESLGGTEEAIYVALDIPEDDVNVDCYDNRSGLSSQEWEAFELFMGVVDTNYCVDLNKIYVAGYSTGGWLANMWGCYFAGWPTPPRTFGARYHIRGQIAEAGGEPDPQPTCGGPVAALWLHDQNDPNAIAGDIAALTRVGRMNGCDTTYDDPAIQVPWHPEVAAIGADVCKKFTGCPADYPVVFCTTQGSGRADQSSRMIPAAKLFLDEIEAAR